MEINDAAYNCDWTTLPPREAKLLILLMSQAQIPWEITVGKFASFSLELYCNVCWLIYQFKIFIISRSILHSYYTFYFFLQILKTSAGYLSVLLAVKDKVME